jgi:hypothetical protein
MGSIANFKEIPLRPKQFKVSPSPDTSVEASAKAEIGGGLRRVGEGIDTAVLLKIQRERAPADAGQGIPQRSTAPEREAKLRQMSNWDKSKGSIEALHKYWSSRAGGLTPQRNDIEPADIKSLLPFLYIVAFERDPFRVRYILTGTEADRWNGFNLTGRYVDEFLSKDIHGANRVLLDAYRKAFETAEPAFCTYTWPTRAGYTLEVRVGMFPLRVGAQIEQCLAIEDYSGFSRVMADDGVPFEDAAKRSDTGKADG